MSTEDRITYQAWNTQLLPHDQRGSFKEVARNIVEFANCAPSTHNTQPVRWEGDLKHQRLILRIDPYSVLPESDKVGRQAQVSTGTSIKNAEIAAAALGWDSNLMINPVYVEGVSVAEMQFEKHSNASDLVDLQPYITRRMTHRGTYDRSFPVTPEISKMIAQTADANGVRANLITDRTTLSIIADLQERADSYVVNNREFSRELGDWIIEDRSDNPLGMPGSGFGIAEDSVRYVIERLKTGLGEGGDTILKKAFPQADREGINSAAAELTLLTDEDNLISRINSGRAYQQIALELTKREWSTAMNAAFVEVGLFSKMVKARLMTKGVPMVFCRIGRPLPTKDGDVIRGHSPRLPIESIYTTS